MAHWIFRDSVLHTCAREQHLNLHTSGHVDPSQKPATLRRSRLNFVRLFPNGEKSPSPGSTRSGAPWVEWARNLYPNGVASRWIDNTR